MVDEPPVTLLASAPTDAPDAPGAAGDPAAWRHRLPRAWWEHLAVAALLLVWGLPLTHATGGRDPHALVVYAAVALAAFLVTRAWRVHPVEVGLATAVAAAAVTVCAVSPTGWWGADFAAGYVVAAASYLVVRRYATDRTRATVVLAGVTLVGLEQFGQAFLPWWGGRDPSVDMSGTFYWHNPYAAFLLAPALLGLGLTLRGERPWRLVGWAATPLCVAGIVLSSSRATLAALLVAWLAVLALAVRNRVTARRAAALTGVALMTVLALPGPPLFDHWRSPTAATQERAAAGETLSQNGYYRTQFWREAAAVATHHPVSGAGFHSLATASALYTPVGWARSQLAHNGYLQPLSAGGLLLGLPALTALALIAAAALLTLRRRRGTPRGPTDPVAVALAVSVLAAMAHALVDFDWSHPALRVQLALLAACLPALRTARRRAETPVPRRTTAVRVGAATVLVLVLGVELGALHAWQRGEAAASTLVSVPGALQAAGRPFGDYRPARTVLRKAVRDPATVSDAQAARAMALTAHIATVDVHLALLRDEVGAGRGLDANAR